MAELYDAFICITSSYILYYNLKQSAVARFDYPPNSVVFKELVDADALTNAFKAFLQGQNLVHGNNTIIVLSESLVFYEPEHGVNIPDLNTTMENFYKYVPLHKETMVKHVFSDTSTTHLLAFDKRLPQLISNILEEQGWKIAYIVPISVFQTGVGDQITPEHIKLMLSNEALLLKSKLPLITKKIDATTVQAGSISEQKPKSESQKIVVLAICLLGFLSVSTYALISAGYINLPGNKKIASISERRMRVPTTQIAPTYAPTIILKNKDALTVRVHSQSTQTDAAEVTRILTERGFTNITYESEQLNTITVDEIYISSAVSADIQSELLTTFSPKFPSIKIIPASQKSVYDIYISVH